MGPRLGGRRFGVSVYWANLVGGQKTNNQPTVCKDLNGALPGLSVSQAKS